MAGRLAVVFLVGYLIGSINWAYLIMRLSGKGDLRRLGTGNLGARNVKRQLGLGAAILVYLGDALKGALPVWVMQQLGWHPQADLIIGLGVILGHNYSVWLGWKGGKGLSS
ncbi:MAG: glycerol-3-phosphate acyltransferase, partial [Bacillota bacterium]